MDRKLKHLDFIQGVINRLSTNSFLLKGWSVVIVSALFALAAKDAQVSFIFLAYFPAVSFWILDGYFLSLERGYRNLYEKVRLLEPNQIDFSMDIREVHSSGSEWFCAVFSKTLIIFHGVLVVAISIVSLLIRD